MKTSVIIPVYNEEKNITKTILSLLKQDFNDSEIIIVDSASTDRTLKVIRNLEKKYSRIKVFECHEKNISKTRNIGVKKAGGKYVLFLDAGYVAPSNWISKMSKMLDIVDKDVAGVGGIDIIKNLKKQNIITKFANYDNLFRRGRKKKLVDTLGLNNSAFKKEIISKIDYFDESFFERCEDSDLCYKVTKKYKLLFEPRIAVQNFEKYSIVSFVFKQILNGAWHFFLYFKHPKKGILGDSYRKPSFLVQPVLWFVFFPIMFFIPYSSILLMLLLLGFNLNLLLYVRKKESISVIFYFYLLCVLRSFFLAIGIIFSPIIILKSFYP